MKIFLRIWLKIPDAEAATVKNTLVRRLGYSGIVEDVRRERLLLIDTDAVEDPAALARQFARELVNENKENYLASVDTIEFEDRYVPVKVGLKIEDGEAMSIMSRLVHRLGLGMVRGVERSNVWKLYIRGKEKENIAREIAEQLLINPNKDYYEIVG